MTAHRAAGVVGNDSGIQPESAGSIPARRSLRAVPITLADANRFVEEVHRHNGRLPSAKLAIAAIDATTGEIHGVAIAGRPKARMADDGYTLEVNRVCTDGTSNCCSFLQAAMGHRVVGAAARSCLAGGAEALRLFEWGKPTDEVG